MEKPKVHIFVCGSFRVSGAPQGVCQKKGGLAFIPYIEEGLRERDIDEYKSNTLEIHVKKGRTPLFL